MNKTPRLSKSGIEYLGYSWGVFSGCRNLQVGICSVKACWAKGIANHYPKLYPKGFEPTFYPEAIDSPKHLKKPSLIGVGWVGDVIGYGLEYKEEIYETIKQCPWHTFLFLTKNSEELIKWGIFPDNSWVGVSATDYDMALAGARALGEVKATVKFISYEPLLGHTQDEYLVRADVSAATLVLSGISWVIIGAQARPSVYPHLGLVEAIVESADKAGAKVFLKNNLGYPKYTADGRRPFYTRDESGTWVLRQETP